MYIKCHRSREHHTKCIRNYGRKNRCCDSYSFRIVSFSEAFDKGFFSLLLRKILNSGVFFFVLPILLLYLLQSVSIKKIFRCSIIFLDSAGLVLIYTSLQPVGSLTKNHSQPSFKFSSQLFKFLHK